MESYNDTDRAVFDTWVDGYDNPTTNGGQVGYGQSAGGTFNETKTTHGGKQSMPLKYNNSNGTMTSEAVRTFDTAADWTVGGIGSLSLYFYGQTTNPTAIPFWIKLTDQSGKGAKVTYGAAAGEDVANLAKASWTAWKIPLGGFSGVTLSKIKSITIGCGPGAGTGTMESRVRGPFSRAGSFEDGGGSEATPGPLVPSRGRLGYTSIRSRFSPRIGVRGDFEADAVP